MRLSEIHPIFYYSRIEQKRLTRRVQDFVSRKDFSSVKKEEKLNYTVKKHQSLLMRKLGNSDPQLQRNKITNLKIAANNINGILVRPNETFSFWHTVGKTTKKKGYIEGMQLSRGKVKTGIGGGVCQMANLLFWLALHSPLDVTERHHHSFDPFPDHKRVLPFGSGASVFYNYVDLRFHNPTNQTFQLNVFLTDKHLKGNIVSDEHWGYAYHIEERNHQFVKQRGKNYRANEIWRNVIDKRTGNRVKEEKMITNFSEVKYEVKDDHVQLYESGRFSPPVS